MAVEFKVEHTRTSEYLLAPKDITFKPELNGRHDCPDIEELIQSMVAVGQLQPILIRNDGGTPILVAGFSRWRAAVEINNRKLTPQPFRLRCVYFKGSEQQGVLANIAENRVRNSTTPVDDGYNICRLERYGMTIEEIAKVYGEEVAWVKKRASLVSLTPEAQTALKKGEIKPEAAIVLAKMSEAEQRREMESAKKRGKVLTAGGLRKVAANKGARVAPVEVKPVPVVLSGAPRMSLQKLLELGAAGEDLPFAYPKTIEVFCSMALEYASGKTKAGAA